MQREWITVVLEEHYSFDGDINVLITKLAILSEEYAKKGYQNLRFEDVAEYDSSNYVLYGDRYETDKEFEKRKKAAEKRRAKKKIIKFDKEAAERAQWEKLNKKFGNDSNGCK